ncbi:MAG: inositol monophosphatase family protein [Patescibacteria group bacterium]|jgi:3'-phosphoadenosine 5'-phosphosulfate (PAPS) 3'-phosphatase
MLDIKYELDYMTNLVRAAAKQEILPRFGKVTGKQKGIPKKFRDIVTEADVAASKYILDRIRPRFPGSYSEEQKYENRFKHDLIWQIDPVDGTDEFCAGLVDGYAVNAALLQRQPNSTYKSIAGLIYLPGVDKLWRSDQITTNISSRSKLVGWVRKLDPNKILEHFYYNLGNKLGLTTQLYYDGGSGASIAALLADQTNLVIMNYNYSKDWDIAMAEPILKAYGGFICDLKGNDFTFNRPDSEGYDEPYNLNGYIASLVFTKDEILSHVPAELLINRL